MSFDMYKTKYLKYKKKYLELQDLINKQFAGAAMNQCFKPVIFGDLYPDISSTYNFNNLNDYFTNPTFITNPSIEYTTVINNGQVNIRFKYYNSITRNLIPGFYVLNLRNNPRNQLPVQPAPPAPQIPIIKGGQSDSTTYIYYYNRNGVKNADCPNDEIHLTESFGTLSNIIGKNFGLKCNDVINNSNPRTSIISDLTLNPSKKVLIIDWQNIINNLLGSTPISPTKKTDVQVKFNFFLYENIVLKNNYVFIIFKKSLDADIEYMKDIINGPYDLKSYIRNTNSKLQIIITSVATKYLNPAKPAPVRHYYGNFTNPNFESNYKIIWDDGLTSSFDDFVFWVVVVFVYNLIRNKVNIDYTAFQGQPGFILPTYNFANLEIYTLDKQKLDINCQQNGAQPTYYQDITDVNIPANCFNNPNTTPNKNLFNMVYPTLNALPHPPPPPNNVRQLDMNNPFIYCYFLNFNSTTNPMTEYDNIVQPNNWFYSNDKLLNIYIDFILKLFGNTPIKLNPRPNNFIYNAFVKMNLTLDMGDYRGGDGTAPIHIPDNYWTFQCIPISHGFALNAGLRPINSILSKHYNQPGLMTMPPIYTNLQNNIDPIVALWEKFNTDNLCLGNIRTDTVNFFFNNFPFEGTGVANDLKAIYQVLNEFLPNNIPFDFANKGIHPGLLFYAQVKHIQNNFYGAYDNIKSDIQERMGLLNNYQEIKNDNTKKNNKIKNNLECEKRLVNKIKSDKLNLKCENKRLDNLNQAYYQEGSQLYVQNQEYFQQIQTLGKQNQEQIQKLEQQNQEQIQKLEQQNQEHIQQIQTLGQQNQEHVQQHQILEQQIKALQARNRLIDVAQGEVQGQGPKKHARTENEDEDDEEEDEE